MIGERDTVHSLVDTKDAAHCSVHQTVLREANVFGIFSAVLFQMTSEDQLWKLMN